MADSKIVLITGAGSGIGAAIAQAFAQEGHTVLLAGRRAAALTKTLKTLPAATGRLSHRIFSLDLSQAASIEKLVQELTQENLMPDILINNAGQFQRNWGRENHPQIWRDLFEVNLFGTVNLTEKILPSMISKKDGVIINISSTLGLKPVPSTGIYSASKAALWSWTQSLAAELGPHQIRVNAVSPGIVETPIHEAFRDQDGTETADENKRRSEARATMAKLQPLGRIGRPEDIAAAVLFLASQASAWTTGASLNVDGGIHVV